MWTRFALTPAPLPEGEGFEATATRAYLNPRTRRLDFRRTGGIFDLLFARSRRFLRPPRSRVALTVGAGRIILKSSSDNRFRQKIRPDCTMNPVIVPVVAIDPVAIRIAIRITAEVRP